MQDVTTNSLDSSVSAAAAKARKASFCLASASPGAKEAALCAMAGSLMEEAGDILRANSLDVEEARDADRPAPFIKRLEVSASKLEGMARAIRNIATLPDPCGRVLEAWERPNGLLIQKVAVPFGVVGIIYESRPDVTSDVASLCVKSGNAAILKGGSESRRTNPAVARALRRGLETAGLPQDSIQYLDGGGHASVQAMLRARGLIDLMVPRGGRGLIDAVVRGSLVPVIETGTGNCHIYVNESADQDMAVSIIINAKCQNPAVCNAVETVLVDRSIAKEFLPRMCRALVEAGVEVRGCSETRAIVPEARAAAEADWDTEYLGLVLAVKVVGGLKSALHHISRHGTGHSEAIVTGDEAASRAFQAAVDAACVYVNASTRFTDGGEFGLGAEVGISTQKLHARGPVGLAGLTTYKYLVSGTGQIR